MLLYLVAAWAAFLNTQCCSVAASKVLVVFPYFIRAPNSHVFVLNRVIQELADRGHSVGVSGTPRTVL